MNRSQSVKRQTKASKRRIENARKKNDAKQKRVQACIRHKAETSNAKTKSAPMFRARNIQYEVSDRIQAIGHGGIGLIHSLAQQSGLIDAIDRNVQLLKFHFTYHESDHVLNIAYRVQSNCAAVKLCHPPCFGLRETALFARREVNRFLFGGVCDATGESNLDLRHG